MARSFSRPGRSLACLLFCIALAAGCDRLDPPKQSGELVVAVRADPVFYEQEAGGGASGFDHDLAVEFARELGVRVRFVIARDHAELLKLVRDGKAHFAAAVPVIGGDAGIRYTPPLQESRVLVARHADDLPRDDLADLVGRPIEALPGSQKSLALRLLSAAPPLSIVEVPLAHEVDLLARVAERKAELCATDEIHFDVAINFHPDIAVAFELQDNVAYVWAFHIEDVPLHGKATAFIERVGGDGTLARIHDRYYGHIKRIEPMGAARFLEHVRTRLPDFRHEFQQAQEITGLDWRLLAALAYQESNWDPLATSPTNVRGMMMLTEDTADRLKVTDRLDARQSIRGGARYLADLRDDLPPTVKEPDRTWMALAAYNLGMGHFNGARAIAGMVKRDPDAWYEMKRVLPLLSQPRYYERLKSGRGRGGEAVILAENVRTYYDILSRFEPPYAGLSFSRPPK
ncbi:MAG: membrane-bound lytic murein transglycosylase MltF [Candidatus Nitricoxidivorans perseverans]|uniref:Membrane-bound lytic murein transglycosylase MltF n=1 Tax=Candidatus Nitricoxidivorans perseverans TaxID=2975601 RepID=A0AA49FNA3_9PROT|nr:MAG: membrane-bound lytic murein transglycosylase MltF [Candidatus Nitricoxidivorans perseverans]